MTPPKHPRSHGAAPEPTRDELLAMAFADGELSGEESTAFERRVAIEPELARQVAEHRAVDVLAREMAPPEPADHEWARLELDPVQRAGVGLGYASLVLGALGLAVWAVAAIARSELPLLPKVAALAAICGAGVLFLTTLRARLRILPYDPYRDVHR